MWQPPRGSILVGIDGSAAALAAVRWAARDAALRKLPLALVHVVDASLPEWFEVSALAGFRQRQEQRAREFLESAIEAAEESFGECDPVPIDSNVFHSASVSALVGLSAEVAMVVVGRRGHGASVYNVPGRVSSALVYHAHCPVAVIHESEGAIRNFEHAPVLVGIDGSPASEAATGIAFEEASRRGVGLTALHVWVDPMFPAPRPNTKTPSGTLDSPRKRRRSPNGWRVGTTATPTWRSIAGSKSAIRRIG